MSQICSKCGKENESGAKFCVSCGSSLKDQFSTPTDTSEHSSSSKKKPKTLKKLLTKWKGLKRWKKVVICVIVGIMLLSYALPNSESTSTTAKSSDTEQTETVTKSDTNQAETATENDAEKEEAATESDTSTKTASDDADTATSSNTSSDTAATTTKSNDATVKSLKKIMEKIDGEFSDTKSVAVTLADNGNAGVSYTATNISAEQSLINDCVTNYINFSIKAYKYDNVTMTTFDVKTSMVDLYGNASDDLIFSIQMTKDNFEKYNWDNLGLGILDNMEPNCSEFYIHPSILKEIDTSKTYYEGE